MAVLQKELFQDKLEVINSSLVADYYIAQLVCAPLVNLAGRISLVPFEPRDLQVTPLVFFRSDLCMCASCLGHKSGR